MNKCEGCGAVSESKLCERCFRIVHYNDYKIIEKSNVDFIPILENISKTNDLVLLVVDLFNIPNLDSISKYIGNNVVLVLTKRDILPKKMYEQKLIDYDYKIDYIDKVIISSNNNYNFDNLMDVIVANKKSERVYVVGFTNAGKSTMINKLIYNYSDSNTKITTSPIPSTTLDTIEIKLSDELTLIDTPGLLIDGDIINYLDSNMIKIITPKREIKPITYQIRGTQTILIDNLVKIEATNVDLTFYMSNNLKITRFYNKIKALEDFKKYEVTANRNDVVIRGLGFIKTNKKSKIDIYSLDNVDIFTRDSLI